MTEAFLHYVWLHQYFDRADLCTTAGEALNVISPGVLNRESGPDFAGAKVRIGDIQWAGHVEIHLRSSDWFAHRHQHDDAYGNVILHVVWEHDREVPHADQSPVPTLMLKGRVPLTLLDQYRKLVQSGLAIPCQSQLAAIPSLIRHAMLDRALANRLERKAAEVSDRLARNGGDWESTAYQLLARNFGFKVNADPFLRLAEVLPLRILQRHRGQRLQLEALLFGVAGFLKAPLQDPYVRELFTTYEFLRKKYSLGAAELNPAQWRFFRLRPANFPSLRIAQLAALIDSHTSLFDTLIHIPDGAHLHEWLNAPLSDYWHRHYRFGQKALKSKSGLGEQSVDNVIINTLVPLRAAYSRAVDQPTLLDDTLRLLEKTPAEDNRITRIWSLLDFKAAHAFDSQAQIELYHEYCQKRNCLNCHIGGALLQPTRI